MDWSDVPQDPDKDTCPAAIEGLPADTRLKVLEVVWEVRGRLARNPNLGGPEPQNQMGMPPKGQRQG